MEVKGKILTLRPGGRATNDRYAWDYSKSGFYSVKSGYWVMVEVINKRTAPQETLQPSLDPLYQQIWKLDTPPKIHHFLWRCVSNCLSVAENLAHRHLAKEKSCIRCPSRVESVNHLLFSCDFARLTWAISPIPAPPGGEWTDSLYRNIHYVLFSGKGQNQENGEFIMTPWILWRLWKNRNDLVFKGKEYSAHQVINKAKEDVEEWNTRKDPKPPKENKSISGTPRATWRPPPLSWVKCNVDGTWSADIDRSGVGWVL